MVLFPDVQKHDLNTGTSSATKTASHLDVGVSIVRSPFIIVE